MHADIDQLRNQINSLDEQIVRLVNERAKLAVQIGAAKATSGTQIYDAAREGDVFSRIDALNQGPLEKGALEEIYRAIISACREIQTRA